MSIITIPLETLTTQELQYIIRFCNAINVSNIETYHNHVAIVTPFSDKIQYIAQRLITMDMPFSYTNVKEVK